MGTRRVVGASVAVALSVFAAPAARAQQSDSALYTRAQQMVNNGDAQAGRALLDSLLKVVPPDSPRYAETLYWRARLAPTANTAERDFRRIVVDYSLSPRVDDALLRIGQLEFMRGAYDASLQHFQRLESEHPDSPLRSRASYWTARVYFARNDLSHACAANAEASSRADAADVELRNMIDFQNQRCRGVVPANDKPATTDVAAAPVKEAPAKATPAPARVPAPAPVVAAETSAGAFMVQVAAYFDRTQAFALADKLRGRGYSSHVDGSVAPYRVRIGRYKTRADAVAMLAKLKAKKIDGFVTKG